MAEAVLDASAVLALLYGEPGAEAVERAIGNSILSAVNLAEVIGKLVDRGHTTAEAVQRAGVLPCEIAAADKTAAGLVGGLRDETRGRNISLADRFCLALARDRGLPVLTGDRAWLALGLDVDIQLIR